VGKKEKATKGYAGPEGKGEGVWAGWRDGWAGRRKEAAEPPGKKRKPKERDLVRGDRVLLK
jgi:hypothetical protein